MTDYKNNIQAFYQREDYNELVGKAGTSDIEVNFKDLTYIPRKTTPLPGAMAADMLKAFGAARANYNTLYLHIPFCNLRCSYCSFYRNPFDNEQVAAYVKTLLAEIALLKEQGAFSGLKIAAVFFGGGTPSVMNEKQITEVLNSIHQNVILADDCELTFESSIYDLSDEKLAACLTGGINRFSFGVQSFDTQLRRSLGRLNSEAEVIAKLEQVASTKARVIVDLIYGLAGQSKEMLLADIDKAINCGVSGLDLYKLQIMPKSPLGEAIAKGKVNYKFQNRDLAEMFLAADEYLQKKGARELSCCHWAMRDNEESRYNTLVKSGANIIACGCSCGGRMGAYKYMKTMDRNNYSSQISKLKYPVMVMGKQQKDYSLLEKLSGQCDAGLLDFAALDIYSDANWQELLDKLVKHWCDLQLLRMDNNRYRFTAKGKFYYRQMDRVLLTAAEYALYGKPGLVEQAGQKMMGLMKNMK